MAEQKQNDGFKTLDEAQVFIQSFGDELSKRLNGDKDVKEDDELVTKYLNYDKFKYIAAGKEYDSVSSWLGRENKMMKITKNIMISYTVNCWMTSSIAASYKYNITFINNKQIEMNGIISLVIGNDKKITFVVQTPQNDDLVKILKLLGELQK